MTGPVTVDASVFVRATNLAEDGHDDCRRLLRLLGRKHVAVILPTLIIAELAGALGRRRSSSSSIKSTLERVRNIPGILLVSVDEALAEEAAELAVSARLRGADAIYAATARRYGAILVTVDEQQRLGAAREVETGTPLEVIVRLEER
jgi:predicted nucleic acid-binding protein